MIVGITANKTHGKDFFADAVVRYRKALGSGVVVDSFALPLKQGCAEALGLPIALFTDPSLKEVPFEKPIDLDTRLDALKVAFPIALEPRGKVAHSPREVLQYVGTEYVRSVQNDYWYASLLARTVNAPLALVPDLRFQNEAKAIRSVGGKVLRVVRKGIESKDSHASEVEMGLIEPDVTLVTPHMMPGPNLAALALAMNPEDFFYLCNEGSLPRVLEL